MIISIRRMIFMEKEKSTWIAITAIIGLVIICVGLLISQNALNDSDKDKTLTVSGTSELTVNPDQAIMYINVLTEENTAEKTQSDNKAVSNKVMDALKTAGINDANIETSGYYLSKKYDWNADTNKNVENGYTLTHTLKVTTTDVDNIGKYIDVSIAAGANGVDSIEFSLTKEKEKEVKATALAKATVIAKDKATSLASTANVHLGRITSISENDFGYTPFVANVKQSYDSTGSGSGLSSNIAPQKVDVSASVQVIYELR
jgi:uncharacterized protein